jgi:hypothetical protein
MAEAVGDDAGERLRGILAAAQSDDSKWTAGRVLQALAEPLTPPPVRREPAPAPAVVPPPDRPAEPEAAAKPARAWMAITAIALVVVALAVFIAARGRRAAQVEAQAAAAQAERPTVIAPPPALSPAPAVEDTRTRTAPAQPGWAVIAATYGAHAGAEKRAEAIRRRWPEFKPAVHPPAGEGRHYYVILGSGLTRDEAAALQRRARQAGMPADTYVTKLRAGHLPAGQ